MIKFLLFSLLIGLSNIGYTMGIELPDNLKKMGLTNPKDFTACNRNFDGTHPLLHYKLDPESISEMAKQYDQALLLKKEANALKIKATDLLNNAYTLTSILTFNTMNTIEQANIIFQEEKSKNEKAFKMMWEIAERGYAPANREVCHAFMHGEYGMKNSNILDGVFLFRPQTIEEMIKAQEAAKRSYERQPAILQKFREDEALAAAAAALNNDAETDPIDSDYSTRDSDDSADSVFTPLLGVFSLIKAQPTATRHKKDN
jgi:hypothetical protein